MNCSLAVSVISIHQAKKARRWKEDDLCAFIVNWLKSTFKGASYTMACAKLLFLVLLVTIQQIRNSHGHGRLMDPVNRSSAWRLNFSTPINNDDDQNYCGGLGVSNKKTFKKILHTILILFFSRRQIKKKILPTFLYF